MREEKERKKGEGKERETDILPVINNMSIITDIKGPDVERGDLGVPVQVSVHLQHRRFTGESPLPLHTQTLQSDWLHRLGDLNTGRPTPSFQDALGGGGAMAKQRN